MATKTERPQGVLLDIDGTLLDSNDQHAHAWVDGLAEFGIHRDVASLRRLIGKGGDKILPDVAGIEDTSERGKAIVARHKAIFRERYLPTCRPFPCARELVARMKADGLTIAVATSAAKEELAALLRAARVEDLIEETTTSSDADSSKPDPDIVVAAARKTGLPNEVLIMLGDTPYDIQAATRAGIGAVAVRCGGWSDSALEGALAVYDGAADLLEGYDKSPFKRR